MSEKVPRANQEERKKLTPEQRRVMREKGTEPAFSGKYYRFKGKGIYRCASCGNALFDSETKFDSGSGWPSFWAPASEVSLDTSEDTSHGMVRTEVTCGHCGAHLGHVFEDGPQPTGLRYCINSIALDFEERGE
jgi:peptide-methionine (R)-S-oxide reductase